MNVDGFSITATHEIIINFGAGNFVDDFILVQIIFGANYKVIPPPPPAPAPPK